MELPKEYTQREILTKIDNLKDEEDRLTRQRKELNKALKTNKAQIEYWENFDLSQLKLL